MTDRATVPLSEVADVTGGYAFKSKEYVPSGHFILRTLNISDQGRIDKSSAVFLSQEDVNKYSKFSLSAFDTVFVRVGSPGKTGIVTTSDLPALLNDNMWRIRAKKGKCDPRFLHYCVLTNKRKIEVFASGSAQSFLRLDDCRAMLVEVPPLADQKAIAHILGALDDKIELNQKMNQTLEEVAKAIFKSWFVDFDPVRAKAEGRPTGLPPEISDLFPNELVDSEIGEIPKGWSVFTLGDLVTPKKGKSITKKKVIEGSVPVVAGGLSPAYYHNTSNVKAPAVTVSASGANAGFARLYNKDIWASDCSFISEEQTPFVFLWYVFLKIHQEKIYHMQQGAAQPHIYPSDLMRLQLAYPESDELWCRALDLIAPMFLRIGNAEKESETLSELRDTLLPRLISGDLRIPDAETFLEEAGI